MYCPHCGTELPKLNLDIYKRHKLDFEAVCPNEECGTHLEIEDQSLTNPKGRTEIIMY